MARILLIDDDEMILELLTTFLEQAGHEAITACDGEEGMQLYHQEQPDLVVADVMMSPKGGLSVIRELRIDFPLAKIIAMSADHPDVLKEAQVLGANYAFIKPFSVRELLEAANRLLEA